MPGKLRRRSTLLHNAGRDGRPRPGAARTWLQRRSTCGVGRTERAPLWSILRRHGEAVRSVVLDGVAPPGMRLPLAFPADGQRAFDLMLESCEEHTACNERFPNIPGAVRAALGSPLEKRLATSRWKTHEPERQKRLHSGGVGGRCPHGGSLRTADECAAAALDRASRKR